MKTVADVIIHAVDPTRIKVEGLYGDKLPSGMAEDLVRVSFGDSCRALCSVGAARELSKQLNAYLAGLERAAKSKASA